MIVWLIAGMLGVCGILAFVAAWKAGNRRRRVGFSILGIALIAMAVLVAPQKQTALPAEAAPNDLLDR